MSVRPITQSEEIKAKGHPFVNIFAIFGASQGLLVYLHRHRIPLRSNWLAAPGSPFKFSLLVFGGYLAGGALAIVLFSDAELLRLHQRHIEDKLTIADG